MNVQTFYAGILYISINWAIIIFILIKYYNNKIKLLKEEKEGVEK